MSIQDFKVENGLVIEGIKINLSSAAGSGGLVFDSSSSEFVSSVGNIPVGVVRMWASGSTSPTVPTDYLICDGRQNLNQEDYPILYSVIGDRYTDSPNATTFGLPYFNASSFSYPLPIGIDKATDDPSSLSVNIGESGTTAHTHTSGAGFVSNATSTGNNANHTHAQQNGTDTHFHNFSTDTNSGGSHNHTTSNASTSSAHDYQAGNTSATTGQATANHDHNVNGEGSNHSHTSSNNSHNHASTSTPIGSNSSTHNHTFQANLASGSVNHLHTTTTCGFYFIIKYR